MPYMIRRLSLAAQSTWFADYHSLQAEHDYSHQTAHDLDGED